MFPEQWSHSEGQQGVGHHGEGLVNSSVGCRVTGLRMLVARAEHGGRHGAHGEEIFSWALSLVSQEEQYSSGGSRGESSQQGWGRVAQGVAII